MTNKFYSYDPDEGLEEHGTLESAKKSAEMSLEHWREQAGGEGWHENIEHLECRNIRRKRSGKRALRWLTRNPTKNT